MPDKPDAERAKITPQARASLREVAGILASKFTGQILLDCNQGGVRSLTLKHKVPIVDLADTDRK